jgi:hypothetical protein
MVAHKIRRDDIYGNVLFVGEDGNRGLRDLTFEDYRHIIDYLSVDTGIHSNNPAVWIKRAQKVKGFRVHCREDQEVQFEAVEYPKDQPIFRVGLDYKPNGQFSIFDMIGLPLISQEKPLDTQLEQRPDARHILSYVASTYKCLPPSINPVSNALNIDTRKQVDINFVRADGKDLDVLHMDALWEFIEQ